MQIKNRNKIQCDDDELVYTVLTGWTGTFEKTSLNAYNSKSTCYMTILMTFLEKLENFAFDNSTLV